MGGRATALHRKTHLKLVEVSIGVPTGAGSLPILKLQEDVVRGVPGYCIFNDEKVLRPLRVLIVDVEATAHPFPITFQHLQGSDIRERPERAVKFGLVPVCQAQKAESPERPACCKVPYEGLEGFRVQVSRFRLDGEVL